MDLWKEKFVASARLVEIRLFAEYSGILFIYQSVIEERWLLLVVQYLVEVVGI